MQFPVQALPISFQMATKNYETLIPTMLAYWVILPACKAREHALSLSVPFVTGREHAEEQQSTTTSAYESVLYAYANQPSSENKF